MKPARVPATLVLALVLTGCTSYLITAPEPRYADEHRGGVASVAWGTASSPYPGVVAEPCGSDQLAMVRVTRNFGQALVMLATLGIYAPVSVHYFCALPPQPPGGTFDTNED